MQRAWLFLILSGCWQTRSAAGTFLTDVHIEGDQLVSEKCDVDFTTAHTPESRDSRLETAGCSTEREPFPTDTLAAVLAPECRDSIEKWQSVAAATPSKRDQVWRSLSAHCRDLIAGDVR